MKRRYSKLGVVSVACDVTAPIEIEALGPEFIRMADEPCVVLELPGSIVSKKGRSCSSQREVSVVLPSGQSVLVKSDIKSRGRDVFDMVVAHANLVEHFYFGLAFIDDDEYFFLDHEIKISKIAPDSWKKVLSTSFLVFLRVRFSVDDISFILHRLTRHQYYLQLQQDILEDPLYCNEETGMFLAALALQAEFGDYMNYYQPEQYVSKRTLEKMSLPTLKEELPQFHANNAQMLPKQAKTESLSSFQSRDGVPSGRPGEEAHDENIEKDQSICRTCDSHKKPRSCSEVVLNSVEIPPNLGQRESLSKSCDEITAKVVERELREINRDLPEQCPLSEMKEQAW
ncbi:unnamed protein product, partial [Coregonus sp. 'balchen']